jgi:hypothetical protein
VRTGGVRVSMRFIGPEEDGVVAVSRTLGSSFVGIFAAGSSPSDAASPFEGGGEGVEGSDKGGTVSHKGAGSPWGPLIIWVSLAFYIFPCTWKLLPPWLP